MFAAIFFAISPAVAGGCPPEKLASFDITLTPEGKPIVPVVIGGHTISLKLDSGGFDSMLTETTVRTLDLRRSVIANHTFVVGNDKITQYATASDVSFGGRHMATLPFMILPDGHLEAAVGGTLGPNLLRQYGVELDFGGGKVNLFSTKACDGSLAYWTNGPASVVPIAPWRIGPFTTQLKIDGKSFAAIVSTGIEVTSMPFETAQRLGLITDAAKLKPVPGQDGYFTYTFGSLAFENGPVIAKPDIVLIRHDQQGFDEDMVLGVDILRQFHIYIAYGAQKMFMTPAH
ncbi:MAG TPA: pepsin/retropepsin-like aspartic protease family protein [Rhizomicrobium sp.]|nr:pepsin/retropepsin-like aspartic protease family protein [Rhizomicrobium sp.]